MFLLLGAFIAGLLTVLAPCVLPLLPIIIGGSVSGNTRDARRPIIITASLAISLLVFTLLLKATTLFIAVPPQAITDFSGGIIVALGIVTLFPTLYAKLISKLGIEQGAQRALSNGYRNKNSFIGPIITGAALGPVFSSCSPVYAYILATVLPVRFNQALTYIIAYILGLSIILLIIGYFGQRFISKIKFASNPKGIFQRFLAIIFIIVGLMIITGYGTVFQTWVSEHTPFNFDSLTTSFLPATQTIDTSKIFNVQAYPAPALTGLNGWLNSDPLVLSKLKGKVVLIDFWTYSCINCIRNNPYLEKWYQAYKKDGLVVIGIHAPEFAFEQIPANVETGVMSQHITYPVALDNNYSTWNAFNNRSWPTSYLIDTQGQIRRIHEGEGEYDQEEQAIRELLREGGAHIETKMTSASSAAVPVTAQQTPETYLGSDKASNYIGSSPLGAAATQTFTEASQLAPNQWTLGGTWEVQGQEIIARGNSTLRFHIAAKDVYLVGGSPTPVNMGVLANGKSLTSSSSGSDIQGSTLAISTPQLYHVIHFPTFTSTLDLELTVPNGVTLNTFTFGS